MVQAYLHECLESVLEQPFTDLELIAIDDCSPDGSGTIIDEFAARDPRVRAIHLTENTGLGRARNAGLERATGEYVIFLDSDDSLTPDALHAISDRLKNTDTPDVLVYDYERTYCTGRTAPNVVTAQLTEEGPAAFTLDDRPGLLKSCTSSGTRPTAVSSWSARASPSLPATTRTSPGPIRCW